MVVTVDRKSDFDGKALGMELKKRKELLGFQRYNFWVTPHGRNIVTIICHDSLTFLFATESWDLRVQPAWSMAEE